MIKQLIIYGTLVTAIIISMASFSTEKDEMETKNTGITFQDTSWEMVLAKAKKENKLIFLDAYTYWCGPCKQLAPVLEELSKEYEGKVNIYKIDTEAEQELAAAFGIKSIPSLLFCPSDGQPQMAQGALPKESMKQAIEEVLLKTKTATNN